MFDFWLHVKWGYTGSVRTEIKLSKREAYTESYENPLIFGRTKILLHCKVTRHEDL
jgi:hypothetical protein